MRTLCNSRSRITKTGFLCCSFKRECSQNIYIINLGKFISCSVLTGINVKKWYIAKTKLLIEQDKNEIEKLFAQLNEIADIELKNAESSLPLVEVDSLLGYEPFMGYVCDREKLEWKIKHMKYVIETELPRYKESFER